MSHQNILIFIQSKAVLITWRSGRSLTFHRELHGADSEAVFIQNFVRSFVRARQLPHRQLLSVRVLLQTLAVLVAPHPQVGPLRAVPVGTTQRQSPDLR